MKRLFLLTVLMAFALFANAQEPENPRSVGTHWTFNTNTQYNANMTGRLYLNGSSYQNGSYAQYYEIGVFCGDECRGSFMPDQLSISGLYNGYAYQMQIYSNVESGEQMTFRLYDHRNNVEMSLTCTTEFTFVAGEMYGNLMDPFQIKFAKFPDNIVYVTPTGAGNNSGSSWSNAMSSIQTAISTAQSDRVHTIWVAAGTYQGDGNESNAVVTLASGINIYGGFAGNEPADYDLSLRDFDNNATILDGQTTQRVLNQSSDFYTTTYMDGFTIYRGFSNNSGGGANLRAGMYIKNCKFQSNSSMTTSGGGGGGVYIYGSNYYMTTIEDCVFSGNSSQGDGGAIYCRYATLNRVIVSSNTANHGCGGINAYSSTLNYCDINQNTSTYRDAYSIYQAYCALNASLSTITNCSITRNNGGRNNGGVYLGSSCTMKNCIIQNNTSESFSGVYMNSSGNTIYNCLIANNTGASCAGVYMNTSSCKVVNCDIVNNAGIGVKGTGTLVNTIVWGNETNGVPSNIDGNNITATYSAVTGGIQGTGNIILDAENDGGGYFHPKFENPSPAAGVDITTENISYRLADGSVCVNRGTTENLEIPEQDLDGNERIQQGVIDLGCYESEYFESELPTYGDIIYVKVGGAGMKIGTSWADACDDISQAINIAGSNGATQVWVAQGLYTGDGVSGHNAFTLVDGVSLYGGFEGNEPSDYDLTLRDFTEHTTQLDGQQIQRVLYQPSAFTNMTYIDGFTIQNGSTQYYDGSGAYLRDNSYIRNCVVIGNAVTGSTGGGLNVDTGTNTAYIENCLIKNNTTNYSYGGGIDASGCVVITGCTIEGNSNGGARISSSSVMKNCIITNNNGGTGVELGSNSIIENCLVANNTGSSNDVGGIYLNASNSQVINCDVVKNLGGGVKGNGIMVNNIVWGNEKNGQPANIVADNYGNLPTGTYNAVEGGMDGAGNITLDAENEGSGYFHPYFVNPSTTAGVDNSNTEWSWQLADGSVCVNRGDNNALNNPEYDLAGNARIQVETIDMGCYESAYSASVTPSYDDGIVYVTAEGAGDKTGTSWDNAADDISYAISAASSNVLSSVWIAAGTYTGDGVTGHNVITLSNGVSLYGGFAGNEPSDFDLSQRDFENNATILDGQNAQRVIYQRTAFNDVTYIDGFTVTNGYVATYYSGGGFYLMGGACVKNCIITGNTSYDYGGGIYVSASQNNPVVIEDCVITDNSTTSGSGGGLYVNYATLNRLQIHDNTCTGDGGGVYMSGSTMTDCEITYNESTYSSSYNDAAGGVYASNSTIKNCIITNNKNAANGGGGLCLKNYSTIENSLIANNKGGGIYCNDASAYIKSCDIVRNEGYGLTGYGTLLSCIVWGNEDNGNPAQINGTNFTSTYSAVTGGIAGTGNVSLAVENEGVAFDFPRFENPSTAAGVDETHTAWSYQLTEGSVCANRGSWGDMVLLPEYDLAGNPRVQNGAMDMGCYESPYDLVEIPTYDDGIIYVTAEGAGSKNGDSWANASDDLNRAIILASSNGVSQVWVAAGTYRGKDVNNSKNAFTIQDGVNLYGGFVGDEPADYDISQRDLLTNVTILDGQTVQRVINQASAFTNVTNIDGFTVRNGYPHGNNFNTGAGMYLLDNSYVKNCIITNCNSEGSTKGAVYLVNATMTHCQIVNNTALVDGYLSDIGCGVYANNSTLDNCLIANNSGHGVGMANGTQVTSCDIVNNTLSGFYGFDDYANGSVVNSIIWGNSELRGGGYVSFSYCAYTGTGTATNGCILLSADNVGAQPGVKYPQFLNPTPVVGAALGLSESSWQLMPTSPCLNIGTTDGVTIPAIDLAGTTRIIDDYLDLGCYECNTHIVTNTINEEICQGEDYYGNGFYVEEPEVGLNVYTNTNIGGSYLGYDSITYLKLRVHPKYLIEEDAFYCDLESVEWHGKTLTRSGVYYDSLFTIHSCDSIYKLTLEIYRTPLGGFSYMGPTNNQNMTVMPTLLWTTVPGAQGYDLYLWRDDEDEPAEPYLANMTDTHVEVTGLRNYHTYSWYVIARNACHETTSDVNTFYLNLTPEMSVSTHSIDFGEVAMNSMNIRYMNVTAEYLGEEIDVQLVGDDVEMFTVTKASGWDNYNGGMLTVKYKPTSPTYDYTASIIVSSESLSETINLRGGVTDLYSFTTVVDQEVYSMGSTIPIHGHVDDWQGQPAANIEMEVGVIVMNTKRTIETTTDADGNFTAEFEPLATESGYYRVNSGRVGHSGTTAHDTFNIPGLTIDFDKYRYEVPNGFSKTDSVLVKNKSNLPLTNIQLTSVITPDGCSVTSRPLSLGGLERDYLVYTISGSELTEGYNYQELRLQVASAEGASVQFSVGYYCHTPRSALEVLPDSFETTMTIGKSKIVDVMIANYGDDETGEINIELPDVEWLSVVGGNTMSSLARFDTAYISLRLSPSEDITLAPYHGNIVIHSERGDDRSVYYNITAVSESTGSILIDATDEYTYNTAEAPHLADALVTITGYYSLETVAQGYTDENGEFLAPDLPEGYYRVSVTKDKHNSYYNTLKVIPGNTIRKETFMQYEAITYSYNVEPTEIEDEYTFELVVNYETHVPVPVVTLEATATRELEYGETDNFNLIVTNHGLITSYEAAINFSNSQEYVIVPLMDVLDSIPALTTIIVPCQYTRVEPSRNNRFEYDCSTKAYTKHYYFCNDEKQWQYSESKDVITEVCNMTFEMVDHTPSTGGGGGFTGWGSYGSGGGGGGAWAGGGGTPKTSSESCVPCSQAGHDAAVNALSCLPVVGAPIAAADCLSKAGDRGLEKAKLGLGKLIIEDDYSIWDFFGDEMDAMTDGLGDCMANALSGFVPGLGDAVCVSGNMESMNQAAESCYRVKVESRSDGKRGGVVIPGEVLMEDNYRLWLANWNVLHGLMIIGEMFENLHTLLYDEAWLDETNYGDFMSSFAALIKSSENGVISPEDAEELATSFVGSSVTHDDIISVTNRWNRSIGYWNAGYYMKEDLPQGMDDDFMEFNQDMYERAFEDMETYAYLKTLGGDKDGDSDNTFFDDLPDNLAYLIAINENNGGNSVCSTVKVKFSQKMTMTREAFDGTFEVHNGNLENSIQNIRLTFDVKDKATGEDCTSLFQVNYMPAISNITGGIDGNGLVGPGRDGKAIVRFIPTKNAAPTEPKVYSFGGTFEFRDPYTGEDIEFELQPCDLTVNPCPDLYVDYFMQRDILGDDALTLDIIEPSIPAELGVRIHNKGMGIAKNVTLETAEPEIVDNDKGLAIDFAMYGASFNGSEAQLGLMEIPFGNIESGKTGVGEWLFTSSLLGHFVQYEAHVIHNNSFGNPELSLVSSLKIHELIHPVYVYGTMDDGINDFLVNGDNDAYDMPDTIYFSQGGKTGVSEATSVSCNHPVSIGNTTVILTMVADNNGWIYGACDDPGQNKFELISCTRNSDGQEIPLQNVWQTFVTLNDMAEPLYENKLHILDTIGTRGTVSYTLEYELKSNLLDVEQFIGIPEDYIEEPLTGFIVEFNEAIIDSTFTYEDMTLKCQNGPNLMDENVVITKVTNSNAKYHVDITGLTEEPGLYVLNVNTLNIRDVRGYGGYYGRQAQWNQVIAAQCDTLVEGWNWWSSIMEYNGNNSMGLSLLESSLGSNGLIIKSQTANVMNYYPSIGTNTWVGGLEAIDNESRYLIKVADDCVVSLDGQRTNYLDHPITITPGWNWIGYPVSRTQSVSVALEGFTAEANDVIKSQGASSIYYDGYGWYPPFNMKRGQGYLYLSNADDDKTLTYSVNRGINAAEYNEGRLWMNDRHAFADNMTIVATVYVGDELLASKDIELGAFVDDEYRGSIRLEYFEPLNCYYAVLTVNGEEGEEVSFGIIDRNSRGTNFNSGNRVVFQNNAVIGTLDTPYMIVFDSDDSSQKLLGFYPNPVDRNTTFYIDIPENETVKEVVVTDMLGVAVRRNANGRQVSGISTSGVYDIRVVTLSGNIYHGRLIVK